MGEKRRRLADGVPKKTSARRPHGRGNLSGRSHAFVDAQTAGVVDWEHSSPGGPDLKSAVWRALPMLKTLFGLTTLVLLLVLIGYATSGGPSDANLTDLGLTASAVRDPSGVWRLQFDLRYTGETPLVVYEGSLPWKSPRELLLIACALNATNTRLVPAEAPTRDLPPNSLTLNPGDTL